MERRAMKTSRDAVERIPDAHVGGMPPARGSAAASDARVRGNDATRTARRDRTPPQRSLRREFPYGSCWLADCIATV